MAKKKKDEEELTPWERLNNEAQAKNKRDKKKISGRNIKIPKVQLKKFQIRNLKRFSPLIGLLVVVLLVCVFFITPYSRVSRVTITGNEMISATNIKKYTTIQPNNSLLKVWGHKQSLAREIKDKSQRLASVKVSTSNFNDVNIRVKEYPTIGYLYVNHGYQPILKSGVILNNKVLNPTADYPIVKNFKNPKILKRCIAQYKKIQPNVRANIITVNYSPTKLNNDRVVLKMHDKNMVLGTIKTFGNKMNYYPSMAQSLTAKSVIDMQVGAYSYPIAKKKSSTDGTASNKNVSQSQTKKKNTRSGTDR
ncbi:cell division protein FtsQ/DivIB [Lentilactobacillus sp. SPB1-3]|uniref:Cell division protein FtsQ/DivIB n=1 Tax=Lentilactobacillus terminaliae TaxID=3003483 RepID=A0ACD5DD98_9LACO|nr:cell division protein FtsQ/DivIB [Lentilactobacillus sp. SPB1-3]MCZ0977828.1 FtsQ-type POTRA domain-containing protein [Lentilactobacillus sp. SPB1-3]